MLPNPITNLLQNNKYLYKERLRSKKNRVPTTPLQSKNISFYETTLNHTSPSQNSKAACFLPKMKLKNPRPFSTESKEKKHCSWVLASKLDEKDVEILEENTALNKYLIELNEKVDVYIDKKREENHINIRDKDKLKVLKMNIFDKEVKRNRRKISELKKEYEELEQREQMLKTKDYKKNIGEQIKALQNSIQEIKRGNFLLANDNKRFAKELNSFHLTESNNKTEGEKINKFLKLKVDENALLVEKIKICKDEIYAITEKYNELQKEMNDYKQKLISKGVFFNSTKEHTYYLYSLKICKAENELKIKKKKSELQSHQINNIIFENQEKISVLNKNIRDYEELISHQQAKIEEILKEISQNEQKTEIISEDFDIKAEIKKIFNENSDAKEIELALTPLTLSPGKTMAKSENQDFYLTNCVYETNSSSKPKESNKNEEVIREIQAKKLENLESFEKNQENNNMEEDNSEKNSVFSFENKDFAKENKEKIQFYSDYELQISSLSHEKAKENKEMIIRKTFSHDFEKIDEKFPAEKIIDEILKQKLLIIENKEPISKEDNTLITQKYADADIETHSAKEKETKNDDLENYHSNFNKKSDESFENSNNNEDFINNNNENIHKNINNNNYYSSENLPNHDDREKIHQNDENINKKDFESAHNEQYHETPQYNNNENPDNGYVLPTNHNEIIVNDNATKEENEFLQKESEQNTEHFPKNSIENQNFLETNEKEIKNTENSTKINRDFNEDFIKPQEFPNFLEENPNSDKIEIKSRRINMRKIKEKTQENDFFFDISKKSVEIPKTPEKSANFNLFSQKKSLKSKKPEEERLFPIKNTDKSLINNDQMLEIIELPTGNFKEIQKSLEKVRISSENYDDPEFILFKDPEKFDKTDKTPANPMKLSRKLDKTKETEKTSPDFEDFSPKKQSRLRMGASKSSKKDSPNYFTEFDF